jgi:hypothetical protein
LLHERKVSNFFLKSGYLTFHLNLKNLWNFRFIPIRPFVPKNRGKPRDRLVSEEKYP